MLRMGVAQSFSKKHGAQYPNQLHFKKPAKNMKKPTTLEDYKAYAFGFAMITATFLVPFAIIKLLSYVF